jgi:hypothetical protein
MRRDQFLWMWRVLGCMALCILPLCFPHSPWKPEETRVVGALLNYCAQGVASSKISGTMFFSLPLMNKMFWWLTIEWIHLLHSSRYEVVARVWSVFYLCIGAFCLYGWARATQRRYPHLIPRSIVHGAPLLAASSLGVLIRGYLAIPESIWFAGIALVLWASAEERCLRKYILLVLSALWLMGCAGIWGVVLAIVCGELIPWYRDEYSGIKPDDHRLHGFYMLGLTSFVCAIAMLGKVEVFNGEQVFLYLKEGLKTLLWYGLPLWPLALAVWFRARLFQGDVRKDWLVYRWQPCIQAIITVLVVFCIGNHRWQESHMLIYLPFIVSMALPGLYVVDVRGWFNAVHWFTRSVLILILIAVWIIALALYRHVPFFLYHQLELYQPGFKPEAMTAGVIVMGIILTGYAARYLIVPCRTLPDSLWRWTLGFGCTGCVIRLVLVPYIDYGRSYQSTMLTLNKAIPRSETCIELMTSVGAPQRAMWSYYTKRSVQSSGCRWRIIQANDDMLSLDQRWLNKEKDLWKVEQEAHRPGDQLEKFYVLHKVFTH